MSTGQNLSEKAEDFFVQATLSILNNAVRNIPCKIYLPDTPMGIPIFKFRPSREQYEKISRMQQCSFEAHLIGFNGKKEVSLLSPTVLLSKRSTRYWGPNFSESTLQGEPQNLQVIRHLDTDKNGINSTTHIVFWISPNSMLEPLLFRKNWYHGKITYERTEQISFSLQENLIITFDKHFKTKFHENGELTQSSFLVGCAECSLRSNSVDEILTELISQLDIFLKIVSLGSRTRTACIGFEANFNKKIVQYYRGEISFPSGKSEFLINCTFPDEHIGSKECDSLIKRCHFQEFLRICYNALQDHPNKDAICDAIITLVPGKKRYIDESFLALFSGLETLILDFRKRSNLEFVVNDERDWKRLRKRIKRSVKEIMNDDYSKEQKKFIYQKLNELNRVPLSTAFEKFCSEYEIIISDLWPLFKKDNIVGLSDIRNKYIHGDAISSQFNKMQCLANESLQYMLERILLQILCFPIEKSKVSCTLLFCDPYELCWTSEEQQEFYNYIKK